jgi:pantoate--beta-alanine ligase
MTFYKQATMIVTGDIHEVRVMRYHDPAASWGLVPTMGYLHEGHMALVRRARAENDRVAVSIYVNPAQFAPTEDLSNYPRDLERDLALLKAESVDLIFTPGDAVMYPPGFQTDVIVREVTQYLEGARRPTHFAGVATVVAKLFNVVQPTRAYFGQKDAQQTVVIGRMVRDLNFGLELVICPTVREADGLALSSRNKYLSAGVRQAATVLYRALTAAEAAWGNGERDSHVLRDEMRRVLAAEPQANVDYVSAAEPSSLLEWEGNIPPGMGVLLSLAVYIGKTRLIDNFLLTEEEI